MAAHRTELDRVREEIPDHLLQPIRVREERTRVRIEECLQLDLLRIGDALHGFHGGLHYRDRVDLASFDAELARDDARDIEKIFDELREQLRVPFDHLEPAGDPDRVAEPDAQEAGPSEHGGQRRAQLVRDDGEESVLGLVRVTELAPRILEVMKNLFIGSHVAEDADRTDDVAVGVP